ncbi:MAG: ROK family protein, partial [bacterium]
MDIKNDKRVVLTLDAGGTNFIFSAIEGGEEIIKPIVLPASPL